VLISAGQTVSGTVDFTPWERSFGSWFIDFGVGLSTNFGSGPSCFITSNASWLVGAQSGRAVVARPGQLSGVDFVPPMGGTSAFGSGLGGSPDGSVLLFGDPRAGDGGVVWLLFR
jgi:hypothetical protein